MSAVPVELARLLEGTTIGNTTLANAADKKRWCAAAHNQQGYGGTTTDTGLDGAHSFAYHLSDVESCLLAVGCTDAEMLVAAWAHDVLEDTANTLADLVLAGFTAMEIAIVWACTDGDGDTRAAKKAEAFRKLQLVGSSAIAVKVADRIANVRHCVMTGNLTKFKVYQQERRSFEESLRDGSTLHELWTTLDYWFSQECMDNHWQTLSCCGDPKPSKAV